MEIKNIKIAAHISEKSVGATSLWQQVKTQQSSAASLNFWSSSAASILLVREVSGRTGLSCDWLKRHGLILGRNMLRQCIYRAGIVKFLRAKGMQWVMALVCCSGKLDIEIFAEVLANRQEKKRHIQELKVSLSSWTSMLSPNVSFWHWVILQPVLFCLICCFLSAFFVACFAMLSKHWQGHVQIGLFGWYLTFM